MPSRLRLAQSPAARRKPLGIRCGTQRSGGRCSPREPRELVRRDFIFFSKLPCIVMHLAALFSRFRAYVRQSRRVAGIPGKGMVSLSHAAAFSPKFLNSELTTHESGFLLSAFHFLPFPRYHLWLRPWRTVRMVRMFFLGTAQRGFCRRVRDRRMRAIDAPRNGVISTDLKPRGKRRSF